MRPDVEWEQGQDFRYGNRSKGPERSEERATEGGEEPSAMPADNNLEITE
jgi:hypothetical protein